MAVPMEDWRSLNKRKIYIQKLEESIKALGSNPPANLQNPVEVEKALFEKSKNFEEYRNSFHNIILMLTRKQAHQAQPNSMMGVPRPMMVPGQQQMHQPNPAYQQQYNQYGGMGGAPSQVPNPAYQTGAGMGMGVRPQQPPQYHPGIYATGGNPQLSQQPRYAANIGMVPAGFPQQSQPMHAGSFTHGMGVMSGYNSGGMPGGHYNQPMISGQGPHGGMMRPPVVMRPMQNPRPGMQSQMQPQQQQQSGQSPFIELGVQPVATIPNPYSSSTTRPAVSTTAYTAASNTQQLSSHPGSVPSPYSMSASPATPTQAPPTSMQPSASGGGVEGPLPMSALSNPATPRAGNLHGPVPSPAPPTPLCPASPATSGIGSPAMPAMSPEENEAYLRKLGELQKYIPLMSKWINRLSNDRKGDQFLKLKSLHNLLQDNSRRVPLQTLMKCEIALEKMFKENPESANATKNPSSVPPPPSSSSASALTSHSEPVVPEPKFSAPPQSHSLLDFRMSYSPPPTYSNLMDTIQPRRVPVQELPIVKRLLRNIEVLPYPQSLRLELPHFKIFKVKFEPKKDKFDKTTPLTVSITDENLPAVPPLHIVLPANYPTLSPICDLSHYKQSSVPFIKEVGTLLSTRLAKKTFVYSLSTLLDYWELCILKAMATELQSDEDGD